MVPKLIEGGLYDYPEGRGWCRHGIVRLEMVGGNLLAVDTYWNDRGFGHEGIDAVSIKDKLTFLIDLKDCRDSHEREWQQFEDKDRAHIPMGGGSERWLVKKGARPSIDLQLRQLYSECDRIKSEITSSISDIARKHEEIALLRAKRESDEKSKIPVAVTTEGAAR